ncbi:metallophosphoesterase [bacterium]|nr:metallophosphoesterase [bacterium]
MVKRSGWVFGWQMMARLALLCLTCVPATTAQDYAGSDSTAEAVSTNDGPHVFFADSTHAVVFYFCDDSLFSREYQAVDTVRFDGVCDDTGISYTVVRHPKLPPTDQWSDIEKFFAVSDLHGDFEHFAEILRTAGIVDSSLHWNWGSGHLVVNGDVFDRGPEVTECLWLIYRLEQEAARAGGAVHFLLGNHELMVLQGDLRYVNDRYLEGISRRGRIAYDELFGTETALGRWLRTKPTAIKLNRTLFVHGGIFTDYIRDGLNLADINNLVRGGLDYSSLRLTFEPGIKQAYGSFGPLWYRGYTRDLEDRYAELTDRQLDSVLSFFDADRVVVGHSEQDSLVTCHGGRVVAIDVDIEARGGQEGLLWQDGRLWRVVGDGTRYEVTER